MSSHNSGRLDSSGSPFSGEELYRVFVNQSSEAIWRIELDQPVDVALPADQQIELFFTHAHLVECNPAMARMYGYEECADIVGKRLGDLLIRDDESNRNYLHAFIAAGYKLEGAESHETDRDGNVKIIVNNLVGQVENGFLVRAWGTQRDVTERREINRQRAHLAAIVESTDDAVVSKDLDGRITSWNAGAERIFGFTPEEAVGQSILIIIPDRLRDEEADILGRIRRGESVRHYETFRRRKDGTEVQISLTVSPIRNESGEIIGASKIARDVTEAKLAERRIRESEDLYRALFNSIDEGFCLFEMHFGDDGKAYDYTFIEVNPMFEKLTGLVGADVVGRTVRQALPQVQDRWFEIFGNVALTGESVRYSDRSERTGLWFDLCAVRVGGPESRKVALVFNNITERRAAEQQLRESEEKFAKAFNSSPLVLTITSLETGRLIEVNETFERSTGYTREEAVGKSTTELGLWARPVDRDRELEAVRSQGEIREREYIFRMRDGREIVGLLSAELLEIGGEKCSLTVIQDITERKRAEEISERYRILSNRARDIILFFTPDGKIVDANRVAVETYGYDHDELLSKTIFDIRAEDSRDFIEEQLRSADAGGIQFETNHIAKDGRVIPVEVTSVGADVGGGRLLISIVRDVTERRQNEEMIRQSEKQLRQLADSMPQVVWIADPNGVVKYYNYRVSEFAGITKDGDDWAWEPVLHPEDVAATGLAWSRAVETKDNYVKEHRIRMLDGTFRWHLSRAFPAFDESGAVVKWYGTATDIHDLKQTEEDLRESEQRFRTMANGAPMLVWMSGPDKRSTYFNQTWLDFTGRRMEEEVGLSWMTNIHPDDVEMCERIFDEAFEAREEFEYEYRLRRFDGEYRWILDKGVPLFTHNGTFRGFIGSAIDVTARREGQEALLRAERRASEEYLELLSRIVPLAQTFGTSRDLVSIYRSLREFVVASMPCSAFFVSFFNAETSLRTAAYVWGDGEEIDIAELPPIRLENDGGPNSRAVYERRSVVVSNYWDEIRKRRHVVIGDNGRDPQSSLVVPMAVMSRVIGTLEVQSYDENAFSSEHVIAMEMIANLAGVAIENVRLLEAEAEARESAEAANRAKDEFLSVLSHELRTPLNSMLGWTRMLRAGVLDAERSAKAIEVIERNTLLQNNLIEDLLDVSRIISGKMRIERQKVDLTYVFSDAVEVLKPVATQKKISFDVTNSAEPLFLRGDATRIQQIFVNLVQNAVKFTAEGGRVEVSLERDGGSAKFVVRDNGVGIDEELLPHIFERFRQADSSTKRAFSGLGLGLTIVSTLVELHGGQLFAESEGRDRGATFTVRLPLDAEATARRDRASAMVGTDAPAVLEDARILLVDDDVESLIPLRMFLEKERAVVVTANSAREALERLNERDFHFLLTDIGMPVTDGYDLIARVRQLQSEQNAFITAIALTAYASSEDRRRALSSGFQEHFAKPVDYDELLATLKRYYLGSG